MATTLANIARMTTTTSGTGTVTLGSAVTSFLTFAQAGITDGQTVAYLIEDGNGTGREVGTGVYTSSGTTLTRSVTNSTNSNAAINLSGSAQVAVTALVAQIANKTGDTMSGGLNWSTAVTVASAGTAAIGAAASNYVIISGTATIAAFDTIAQGAMRFVRATGAFTLTYDGTALILPGGVDIVAAAGDWFIAVSEGSGNWRVPFYQRLTGRALVESTAASNAQARTGTSTTLLITPANHVAAHQPAIMVSLAGDQTPTADTWTKVQLDTVTLDSDSCYVASPNYRFTPTVAGYYSVVGWLSVAAAPNEDAGVSIYKNGVAYTTLDVISGNGLTTASMSVPAVVSMNGSTDYLELWGYSSYNVTPLFSAGAYLAVYRLFP